METTMATKFVAWEVPTLETLKGSKAYILREKLNNGGQMNREEKDWLTENVNSNTYFKSAVPLQGWRFDFSDVLRTFLVCQYGRWTEYKATDKTGLRRYLYGRATASESIIFKKRYQIFRIPGSASESLSHA